MQVILAIQLRGLGYEAEVVNGIRRTRDLFERFREHRNAIAHFLFEGEQGQGHVYPADGLMIRTYSMGAVALLKYAHRTLQELRLFYTAHLERILMRGMVLPLPEQRDRYSTRQPLGQEDYGFRSFLCSPTVDLFVR